MADSKDFEKKLDELLTEAEKQGKISLDISSSNLHQIIGGYPTKDGKHQMPTCCHVMYKKIKGNDKIIHETSSGNSSSLIIRYYLPR